MPHLCVYNVYWFPAVYGYAVGSRFRVLHTRYLVLLRLRFVRRTLPLHATTLCLTVTGWLCLAVATVTVATTAHGYARLPVTGLVHTAVATDAATRFFRCAYTPLPTTYPPALHCLCSHLRHLLVSHLRGSVPYCTTFPFADYAFTGYYGSLVGLPHAVPATFCWFCGWVTHLRTHHYHLLPWLLRLVYRVWFGSATYRLRTHTLVHAVVAVTVAAFAHTGLPPAHHARLLCARGFLPTHRARFGCGSAPAVTYARYRGYIAHTFLHFACVHTRTLPYRLPPHVRAVTTRLFHTTAPHALPRLPFCLPGCHHTGYHVLRIAVVLVPGSSWLPHAFSAVHMRFVRVVPVTLVLLWFTLRTRTRLPLQLPTFCYFLRTPVTTHWFWFYGSAAVT